MAEKLRKNIWTVKEIRVELKKARVKEREHKKHGEKHQASFQSGYICALLDVLGEG